MFRFLAIIAVLFISACAVTPGDYVLEDGIIMHVRDSADLHEALYTTYPVARQQKLRINGFTLIGSDPCEIWVRTDRVGTSTQAHEVKHCKNGLFH